MQRLVAIVLISLSSLAASAQYNDSIAYHVKYTSTGNLNITNDGSSYLLNNGLGFNARRKDLQMNFNTGWVYGESNRTLTNNDVNSTLDFNLYRKNKHFYYWGLGNYTSSFSLKINNQVQAGAGVAYIAVENKAAFLSLSDGILFEHDDLMIDTVHNIYQTFRNSFRLSFRFTIKKRIVLDGVDYFQSSLGDINDYIIKSTTNLSFKLNKWLALTASLNYNKLSRTNRDNLLFNYGLTVEKYF